jgi:hypothetical protein
MRTPVLEVSAACTALRFGRAAVHRHHSRGSARVPPEPAGWRSARCDNDDPAIPRNRVRHELVPFLQARFSPGVVDALAREAAIAREDAEYLDAVARAEAERLIVRTEAGVRLSADAVLAQPPAIARRVIRLAEQSAAGGRFIGFDAVESLLLFAVSNSTGPLDLPGFRVNRLGDALVLTKSAGRPGPEEPLEFAYLLGEGQCWSPEAACDFGR